VSYFVALCYLCYLLSFPSESVILTISTPDEGGDLIIWAVAEITTTIVAASIPVLRTLIHDVASHGSSRAYFRATSHDEMNGQSRIHPTGINTITVSASGRNTPARRSNDTDNDGWILHGTASGGIMKTEEVRVRYESKIEHVEDSEDF
jgi:hypothetical protein